MPATHAVMAAVPAERCDYRPDDKSKTALALARHIALEDEWFPRGCRRRLQPAEGRIRRLRTHDAGPCHRTLQEGGVRAARAYRAKSSEALLRTVDMFGAFQMPAVQFLSLAVRHMVHHGGQLSAYSRAAGGKVPPADRDPRAFLRLL
jgi:uncharacterized damage-inducible protein DinB